MRYYLIKALLGGVNRQVPSQLLFKDYQVVHFNVQ